uniref:Uncharacterized protein n=1 Tax=Rhizobium rhizogenes TaxID=359 RepID=A0A7S5DQF5_RHIRH|nr:hypothetical protein pC5.8d_697 [Rhizobium rhizogenes]
MKDRLLFTWTTGAESEQRKRALARQTLKLRALEYGMTDPPVYAEGKCNSTQAYC